MGRGGGGREYHWRRRVPIEDKNYATKLTYMYIHCISSGTSLHPWGRRKCPDFRGCNVHTQGICVLLIKVS